MTHDDLDPATLCVLETERAPGTPLVGPLVRSISYHLDDATYARRLSGEADRTLVYARETNPSLAALEERMASLEGAERTLAFSSGMSALHTLLLATLEAGDHVLVAQKVYGGSERLVRDLLPRLQARFEIVDMDDLEQVESALAKGPRMLLCESLSNPLTAVSDLGALKQAIERLAPECALVVDATLATPFGQRPLEHGADFVWHSATKYLGGHGDVLAGVLSGAREALEPVWKARTLAGCVLDPQAAWLLERSLKSLAVRVRAQAQSAARLAARLQDHPDVERVHYCGLAEDRYHELAQRYLRCTGGLFGFVVRGGDEGAQRVLRRLRLMVEAASLGDVVTLVSRPRDLSHCYASDAERHAAGIVPGFLRVAVGLEDAEDLEADLLQALQAI